MPNSANLYFQFVNNNQQQWNGPSVIRAAPNTPRKQTIKKSVSSLSFATTIGGEGQVWERPVMLAASANVYLVPLQKFSVFQQIFISWIGQHNQFCVETRAWIFSEKFSEIFCYNKRQTNEFLWIIEKHSNSDWNSDRGRFMVSRRKNNFPGRKEV